MTHHPRVALSIAAVAGVLLVAGCGQQTDERVAQTTAPTTAPTEAAVQPPAPSETVPASSPFVSIDCATGEAAEADQAPEGSTLGPITVSTGPSGSPVITVATNAPAAAQLESADIVPGSGTAVAPGDQLTVDYCGVGLGSVSLFDSSWARGEAATFPLDGVIAGWQQGLPGMQVGGQRLLVIPGELAYGEAPPPGILPNETLIFLVDLQAVNGAN